MNKSIIVNLEKQTLDLYESDNKLLKSYAVNTAKNGPGELFGSECTPRGQHIIRAKIGKDQAINTVFVGRRPTGEIYEPELAKQQLSRDWILTRILWLSGTQPGFNRLGNVDSMRRFIYIHGSPDEIPFESPSSHGCINMHNADLMELFDLVPVYTSVFITED